MTAILDDLLRAHRHDAAEYEAGALALSNHLPMAVAALGDLGASPERVTSFATAYAGRHRLPPASPGERDARERWRRRLAYEGRERVLQAELPRLADGIGGAAFHPAIRSAYALARGDDDELAAGLAYWEAAMTVIPGAPVVRTVRAEEALAVLAAAALTRQRREPLIAIRVAAIASTPQFAAVAAVSPAASELPRLAVAAAVSFAERSDFTALHMMTATHAMRVFASRLDVEGAMPGFWRAYAAGGVDAARMPTLDGATLDALRAEDAPGWPALRDAAVAQDDEHVIKATYTAWREDESLDEPVFRVAAARYQARSRAA